MKICLVSTFPPSRRGLSEYGYHVARELSRNPLLSLTILADELPSPQPELEDYSVIRCWSFNSHSNPLRILRAVRELKPDVVWLNLGFASFGDSPLAAFVGLCIPALLRLSGCYTHVTLHQLMETVDLKDAGVAYPRLYRLAGWIITHILLLSHSISVLMPTYRHALRQKYGATNVHVRSHGIFAGYPVPPDYSLRGHPVHQVLAFGKWGTYKRLETVLQAFEIVAVKRDNVRLVVAGGNHPKTPGYVEAIAQKYRNHPCIQFTGYVPEDRIPALFRSASIAAMPYTSSGGSSGVAHLACQYAVPIVAPDIPDFHEIAQEEDVAIDFFRVNDPESLADCLLSLLDSPERQRRMAEQNLVAALRMAMPQVVRQYLRLFDFDQAARSLAPNLRLRGRRPRFSRLELVRAIAPRFAPWV